MSDYWTECIASSLEEHGVTATADQISAIAADVQIGHESHGMAYGHDVIGRGARTEADELRDELNREREKQPCDDCKGRGYIVERGPYHHFEHECSKCRGEGRV